MTPIPAMQAVVKVLESEGVETIFGIPGAAILPFYDALRGSSIRHLTVRHEEGGTHAADGYSRATGRIGVAGMRCTRVKLRKSAIGTSPSYSSTSRTRLASSGGAASIAR